MAPPPLEDQHGCLDMAPPPLEDQHGCLDIAPPPLEDHSLRPWPWIQLWPRLRYIRPGRSSLRMSDTQSSSILPRTFKPTGLLVTEMYDLSYVGNSILPWFIYFWVLMAMFGIVTKGWGYEWLFPTTSLSVKVYYTRFSLNNNFRSNRFPHK